MLARSTPFSLAVLLLASAPVLSNLRADEALKERMQNMEAKLDLLIDQMAALQQDLAKVNPATQPTDANRPTPDTETFLQNKHQEFTEKLEMLLRQKKEQEERDGSMDQLKSKFEDVSATLDQFDRHMNDGNAGLATELFARWLATKDKKGVTEFMMSLDEGIRSALVTLFGSHLKEEKAWVGEQMHLVQYRVGDGANRETEIKILKQQLSAISQRLERGN